jgi:hypothetical protein
MVVASTFIRRRSIGIAIGDTGFFGLVRKNTKLSGSGSFRARRPASLTISTARLLSGTEWSRPAFILAAGIDHVATSRSNSCHCAPSVSLVLVAVRMTNSNASDVMLSEARRRFTTSATLA